jgi:hypothetical protein
LADYHHADLAESLALLFEDRFGWELFFPIGMQWFDSGTWNFEREHHGDAVAQQYLVGVWPDAVAASDGSHWAIEETTHPGRIRKGVELDQARSQPWDVVLSSLPDNDVGLHQLARDTGARFGVQIGNQAQYSNWGLADFGLASSNMPYEPPKPYVTYRQEFRLTDFRYEWPPAEPRSVASFIQCFAENKAFYAEFLEYARELPEFDWKVYGAYGSHPADEFACGNLGSTPDVAAAMRKTRIAWHSKWWSDGYGHVIHNLFATGKPVIGYADYYADKLAGPLWLDGVNSLDLSRHSRDEVVAFMRRLRDDDDFHWQVSDASAKRFAEVVDFDEDAAKVKALLDSVLW